MPRIPKTPNPDTFATLWTEDFTAAVKKAAGRDGVLTLKEAQTESKFPSTSRAFADDAMALIQASGKPSMTVAELQASARAYAERAAVVAAGSDLQLSIADGHKLPAELKEDFFMLRGLSTGAPPLSKGLFATKKALEIVSSTLTLPSETDANFKFVSGSNITGKALNAATIRSQLSAQHDVLLPEVMYSDVDDIALSGRNPAQEVDAMAFLQNLATPTDASDRASVAQAKKFARLKATLESELTDLKVYRFGTVNISTFIVGRNKSGELAGLLTGQVET
jgi:hypothetical protein